MGMLACTFILVAKAQGDESKPGLIVHPRVYAPVSAGPASQAGKELVEKHNCLMCHSIGSKGGCLSPPFDGIGAYRTKKFILARITRGAAVEAEFAKLYGGKAELMPHMRIPSGEAKLVAQYLLTIPAPQNGFYVGSHGSNSNESASDNEETEKTNQVDEQRIAAGKKLFYERGCTACHSIGNIGGHFAPHLDAVGKRRSQNYIEQRITSAELLSQNSGDEYGGRGAVMPPSGLTKDEIESITQFLTSLR